ncbi:MAG: LysR family transcriptional regulator [Rhodobacteraceae bacterium]|nr:LysR family transcriptional regulator [Paracoccaceae bacterium]
MSKPSMDWTGLPYFLAVARGGSLRAAADAMGGNHATVDRHIRAMEAAFDVQLFDRTRTGLHLTPRGKALLPEAEAAERAVQGLCQRLQGKERKPSGTVKLLVPALLSQLFMGPILGRFSRAYPEIDLDVSDADQPRSALLGDADLAVRISHKAAEDAAWHHVSTCSHAVFAAQRYLDLHWYKRGPKGEGLCWVGAGDHEDRSVWVERSPFPMARVRHRLRNSAMVCPMILEGQGMGYLPVCFTTQYPDLVRVPGTRTITDRSVWVVLQAGSGQSEPVRLLAEFLIAQLQSLSDRFIGDEADGCDGKSTRLRAH